MIDLFIKSIKEHQIDNIVVSGSISNTNIKSLLVKQGFIVNEYFDSRSAGYAATGICAECKKPVVLITEDNNDSRNCYSSLTEAYYKKLPIIYVSINTGYKLDYHNELRDTIIKTQFVNEWSGFDSTIVNICLNNSMPVHIVFENEYRYENSIVDISNDIGIINNTNNYLYMSNSFVINSMDNIRKNKAGGCDGIVSNVLGASLSGKYQLYIGICTDDELLHDLNALGNRFMNDAVSFIVYYKKNKKIIDNYARDLGFEVNEGSEYLSSITSNQKSIVFIKR